MRAQVAQRAAAGDRFVKPPTGLHGAVHAPLLQIDRPPMINLPQRAAFDEFFGLLHSRHKAIVERDHVLDASRFYRIQHGFGFFGGARQRFFAEYMLAGLRRGDAGFGMRIVGSAIVQHVDIVIGDQVAPVGVSALVAIAPRGCIDGAFVAARDRHQTRHGYRRIHHVGNGLEGVGVRFAHESIANHADAQFGRVAGAGSCRLARKSAADLLFVCHCPSPIRRRRRHRRPLPMR